MPSRVAPDRYQTLYRHYADLLDMSRATTDDALALARDAMDHANRLTLALSDMQRQRDHARRWARAWRDAATWRQRTGHHKSRAWHMRNRDRRTDG